MKKIATVLALVLLSATAFATDGKDAKAEKGKSCCAGASGAAADKCPMKGDKKACAHDKAQAEKPADAKPADAKPSADKS